MAIPAGKSIQIIPYDPRYRQAFYDLNKAWIDRYFEMEPRDHEVLGDPQAYILDRGGEILVALSDGIPAGVCALERDHSSDDRFELTKTGVDPEYQGRGIGRALCVAALAMARERGAKSVFLESNTSLLPALALYRSLGFREVSGPASPYRRSDIRMEVVFGKPQ